MLHLSLLLISVKHPRVMKLAVYFQFFKEFVYELGLPIDKGVMTSELLLHRNILTFLFYYFDFLPAASCALLTSLAQIPAAKLLYGKEFEGLMIFEVLITCAIQQLILLSINISVNQVGMLFVRTELTAIGNDQVLDSLKEGVVIIPDDETYHVLFCNDKAQAFNIKVDKSFEMSLTTDNKVQSTINSSEKNFSPFDHNHLQFADQYDMVEKFMTRIEHNTISIKELVGMQIKDGVHAK